MVLLEQTYNWELKEVFSKIRIMIKIGKFNLSDLLLLLVLILFVVGVIQQSPWYVTGKNSKLCYIKGQAPSTVKVYQEFLSLRECKKSLLYTIIPWHE